MMANLGVRFHKDLRPYNEFARMFSEAAGSIIGRAESVEIMLDVSVRLVSDRKIEALVIDTVYQSDVVAEVTDSSGLIAEVTSGEWNPIN